jgi:hypothetical protein
MQQVTVHSWRSGLLRDAANVKEMKHCASYARTHARESLWGPPLTPCWSFQLLLVHVQESWLCSAQAATLLSPAHWRERGSTDSKCFCTWRIGPSGVRRELPQVRNVAVSSLAVCSDRRAEESNA